MASKWLLFENLDIRLGKNDKREIKLKSEIVLTQTIKLYKEILRWIWKLVGHNKISQYLKGLHGQKESPRIVK